MILITGGMTFSDKDDKIILKHEGLLRFKPGKISNHRLQRPYALNRKDFPEHFDFTRAVSANKAKTSWNINDPALDNKSILSVSSKKKLK